MSGKKGYQATRRLREREHDKRGGIAESQPPAGQIQPAVATDDAAQNVGCDQSAEASQRKKRRPTAVTRASIDRLLQAIDQPSGQRHGAPATQLKEPIDSFRRQRGISVFHWKTELV